MIADALDSNKKPKVEISVEEISKRAEARYPGRPFLTDLPPNWVDAMTHRGYDVQGHFVCLYPMGSSDFYVAPVTVEGVEMVSKVAQGVLRI